MTGGLVLSGVTVVDTRAGGQSPGMTIVIEDGTITRVAPDGQSPLPANAETVHAPEAYVVPGYLDMHAHPLNEPDPADSLAIMLSVGITGFRQMAGSPALLKARQDGLTLTASDAPELLSMPGLPLVPPLAATAEAAADQVRQQVSMGADFIKVVELSPPVFSATLEAARRQDVPVAGHIPAAVDIVEASRLGMRAIEHLGAGMSAAILIGSSAHASDLRRELGEAPRAGMAMDQRFLANPVLATPPASFDRIRRALDTQDQARLEQTADRFVAHSTWQVPTLIRCRTMQFGDDPRCRQDPNLRYTPKPTADLWQALAAEFEARITSQDRDTLRRVFDEQLRLTRLLDERAVPMLAGSDASGQWVIPGFGLHQEFDLLAEAGLSPLTILQMTTLNGARFLGREATMGSVEQGKDADLVLLSADPTASAANLHAVAGVVRNGTYYSSARLDTMRATVASRHGTD
ncbi:MAG: amidohydrolase family protein [Chloroflexi bacterium]|nr:amidohydrolase family protein [Chloroflexota bacterium]